MKKSENVITMLNNEGVDTTNLSFEEADLTKSEGWSNAMENMDYVIHTASPLGGNNHENPELIPIAKKGVENVLSSAIDEGVEKIVMTSSEAACYPDKSNADSKINESYWMDFNNKDITNYQRSKLIAEKTAWDIIGKQSQSNLVTILPGAIFGPYMDKKRSSTDQVFEMLMKGTPSPNVIYPVGDVRDLAELHILAMENDAANEQRFIAESEEITMPQMAKLLKQQFPDYKVSTRVIPDFIIRVMARFQAPMKVLNTMIGLKYHRDNTKAKKVLGWNPRSAEETVIDTVNYMIESNII